MQRREAYLSRAAALLTAVVLAVCPGGCAGRVYRASKLPPELIAPPVVNLESINLAGLAEQSISSEVIQPGDVLDVTMITDFTKLTTTTTPSRVAQDGSLLVPLVGRVNVGGLEIEQAEQLINAESINRGLFRTPCITLSMKQCYTSQVTVIGAVTNPGRHTLPRGSTSLMTALLAAGGLSKEAGTEVEIRRTDSRQLALYRQSQETAGANVSVTPAGLEQRLSPSPGMTVIKVDLTAAANGEAQLPELHDGDVIFVPRRVLPPVYVMGLVQKPGEIPYPAEKELRVLDALALAGGCSNPAAEKVLVIRRLSGAQEPVRICVSIHAAKNGEDNLALAPGDIVSVEQTPLTAVVDIMRALFRFSVGGSVGWL